MLYLDDIWSRKMLTGIDLIDGHHKVLVGMLVDVKNALDAREEKQRIGPIIDRLISYSRYHFRAEERLMIEYKYPLLAEHREQHTLFVDRMTRGFMSMSEVDMARGQELFEFLKRWFIEHILKKDMDFAEHVRICDRDASATAARTKLEAEAPKSPKEEP